MAERSTRTAGQVRRDVADAIAEPRMGTTRGGRPISSGLVVLDYEGWTPEDHADAAEAHEDAATEARYGQQSYDVAYDRALYVPRQGSDRGHARMAEYHRRKSAALLKKR